MKNFPVNRFASCTNVLLHTHTHAHTHTHTLLGYIQNSSLIILSQHTKTKSHPVLWVLHHLDLVAQSLYFCTYDVFLYTVIISNVMTYVKSIEKYILYTYIYHNNSIGGESLQSITNYGL